ncbi:hypothetical protein ACTHGU_03225 [Chitinophagaceae bacterium MMS25-I14]
MILYLRNTFIAFLLLITLPVWGRGGYEISVSSGQGRIVNQASMAAAFSAGFRTEAYSAEHFTITTGMELSVIGKRIANRYDSTPPPGLTYSRGLVFASLPVGFNYRKHVNRFTFTAGADILLNYFISLESPYAENNYTLGWGIAPNITGSFDITPDFALGIRIFAQSGSSPLRNNAGLQTSMYGAGLIFNLK